MRRLLASLRIALRALVANKMRSGLTMLGIIIGVGAVITMVAVGSGAKARIEEQIASMGSNLLMVDSGSSASGGFRFGAGTTPTLTVDDSKAIPRQAGNILLQGVPDPLPQRSESGVSLHIIAPSRTREVDGEDLPDLPRTR